LLEQQRHFITLKSFQATYKLHIEINLDINMKRHMDKLRKTSLKSAIANYDTLVLVKIPSRPAKWRMMNGGMDIKAWTMR